RWSAHQGLDVGFESSRTLRRITLDGLHHAGRGEAPAEHARHGLLDLGLTGLRVLIEERLGGQDDAAQAEAALRGLVVDERFLKRMRFLRRAEAVEGHDVGAVDGAHRRPARTYSAAVDDGGAGTALPETATEFRPFELQVVAQYVQERGRGIHIDRVALSVDFQRKNAHGVHLLRGSRSLAHSVGECQMAGSPTGEEPAGKFLPVLHDRSQCSGVIRRQLLVGSEGMWWWRSTHSMIISRIPSDDR